MPPSAQTVIDLSDRLRRDLGGGFRDRMVTAVYEHAQELVSRSVRETGANKWDFDQRIDRLLTSRRLGLPLMLVLLGLVFWVTIQAANVPSQMLATAFFTFESVAAGWFESLGAPWWLTGFVWHGVFRGLAWVVSVMLPPMAVFFPRLHDPGRPGLPPAGRIQPRLAVPQGRRARQASPDYGNGLRLQRCGDHFDPHHRLSAGTADRHPDEQFRPVQRALSHSDHARCDFRCSSVPASVGIGDRCRRRRRGGPAGNRLHIAGVMGLSRTVLAGEASAFTLELPPYRRPSILRILYTSLIDRTIFVLGRAMLTAAPAGGVIWVLANVQAGGQSLADHAIEWLGPTGQAIGLDGVILLAYIIAIPANEIVVPTMLMCYLGAGMMMDVAAYDQIQAILVDQHGWTLVTAVNLMLFSLLHNPCATTILTIWKETRSVKWTALGGLMPLAIAFAVCFLSAQAGRLLL